MLRPASALKENDYDNRKASPRISMNAMRHRAVRRKRDAVRLTSEEEVIY